MDVASYKKPFKRSQVERCVYKVEPILDCNTNFVIAYYYVLTQIAKQTLHVPFQTLRPRLEYTCGPSLDLRKTLLTDSVWNIEIASVSSDCAVIRRSIRQGKTFPGVTSPSTVQRRWEHNTLAPQNRSAKRARNLVHQANA